MGAPAGSIAGMAAKLVLAMAAFTWAGVGHADPHLQFSVAGGGTFAKINFGASASAIYDDELRDATIDHLPGVALEATGSLLIHGGDNPSTRVGYLQAGLGFARKGTTADFREAPIAEAPPLRDDPFVVENRIRLDYLVIPLTYRHSFAGQTLAPFLVAGGEIGFLIAATESITRRPGTSEETQVRSVNSSYEKIDLSVRIGGGAEYRRAAVRYFIEIGGVFGQRNVRKLTPDEPSDFTYKNRVYSIMAGLRI